MIAVSPEHAARLILMSCYLYYKCNAPVINDKEFDGLCIYCADHWEDLSPLRQHQLSSASDIKASGYHVLLSKAAVEGAAYWHNKELGFFPTTLPDLDWEFNEEHQLRLGTLK